MKTRILLRQRGREFICYVVERRRWWGWERSTFACDTLHDAEEFAPIFAGADDKIHETVIRGPR